MSFDRRAIPPEARESRWTAADGWEIRRIDWPRHDSPRGSLLFLPGRGDIYEKYLEALDHFWRQGWNVTASDWRGQGGSGRFGDARHVGHVPDFAVWTADLEDFYARWKAEVPGPHVLMGHSMGGHLILRALAERQVKPDAAVLSAPMLGMKTGGLADWMAHAAARLMAWIGPAPRRAWKVSEKPGSPLKLRQALLTHDKDRYEDEMAWWEKRPELKMGPASWGWVERAFASTRLLRRPGLLEHVDVPLFIIATTADQLVDTKRIVALARRLPNAELKLYGKEAAHEILREADPVRTDALAAIDGWLDRTLPRP